MWKFPSKPWFLRGCLILGGWDEFSQTQDAHLPGQRAKEAARQSPGEFKHSWGTAEKLYKSEAIGFWSSSSGGILEPSSDIGRVWDLELRDYIDISRKIDRKCLDSRDA